MKVEQRDLEHFAAVAQHRNIGRAIGLPSAPLALRLRIISATRLLGFSARAVVMDAAHRLGLKELSIRGLEPLQRRCVAVYRKEAYVSAAAKRLVELLQEKSFHIRRPN